MAEPSVMLPPPPPPCVIFFPGHQPTIALPAWSAASTAEVPAGLPHVSAHAAGIFPAAPPPPPESAFAKSARLDVGLQSHPGVRSTGYTPGSSEADWSHLQPRRGTPGYIVAPPPAPRPHTPHGGEQHTGERTFTLPPGTTLDDDDGGDEDLDHGGGGVEAAKRRSQIENVTLLHLLVTGSDGTLCSPLFSPVFFLQCSLGKARSLCAGLRACSAGIAPRASKLPYLGGQPGAFRLIQPMQPASSLHTLLSL
jgi:hypothetical protein